MESNYRFFQICFNGHQEGSYYHNNPLINEVGDELLDYWFDILLDVIILLKSKSEYVAIKELETVNRWLEFKKQGDIVLLNVAVDDSCQIRNLILTENGEFSYKTPLNFAIPYKYLEEQIIATSTKFLNELNCINSNLCKTQMYMELIKKVAIAQR